MLRVCTVFLLTAVTVACGNELQQSSRAVAEFGPKSAEFPRLFLKSITETTYEKVLSTSDKPYFLVEFLAPWCPHCRHFVHDMERLGHTFNLDKTSPIAAASVDCVADSSLCESFHVQGYPTLKFGTRDDFLAVIAKKKDDVLTVDATHRAEDVAKWVSDKMESFKKIAKGWWEKLYTPKDKKQDAEARAASQVFATSQYSNMTLPVKLTPAAEFDRVFRTRAKQVRTLKGSPSKMGVWDAETAAALALHYIFTNSGGPDSVDSLFNLNSPDAKDKQTNLLNFVSLMCNVYTNSTCRDSWCKLVVALPDYIKEASAEMKTQKSPSETELTYLERKWKLCGRDYKAYEEGWKVCQGTYPYMRGYTCGLWMLFHSTIANLEVRFKENVKTIRNFIGSFLGCTECREHFLALTNDIDNASIKTRQDAMLYLWHKHNLVNMRVMRLETQYQDGDPGFPKQLWPSMDICPQCRVPAVKKAHLHVPPASMSPLPAPPGAAVHKPNATTVHDMQQIKMLMADDSVSEERLEQFFLGDYRWDFDAVVSYLTKFYSPPKAKELYWV